MTNKKAWTISIAASLLLVVGVFAAVFGTGLRFFIVETPSMGTTAPVGSLVVVQPRASYEIGDIASYRHATRVYTHRIVDETDQGFIFKGDINEATDALPVKQTEIIGDVVFIGKYLGFVIEALPMLLVGCAIVYGLTLIPRVPVSWRWQIRLIGWSLVANFVSLWFRPWVNMVMMGYVAQNDGVGMHLVNTGIFPVRVLGTVLQSGQDAVLTQTVVDASGTYLVIPELALNTGWFLLMLLICLSPVLAALLIRTPSDGPAEESEPTEEILSNGAGAVVVAAPLTLRERLTGVLASLPRASRRRIGVAGLVVTASAILVSLVLQWSTSAAFTASITNSLNTVKAGYFTCQGAMVSTPGVRFVWSLSSPGDQSDLTTHNYSGTQVNASKRNNLPSTTTSSPCPNDTTQTSMVFKGGTCLTQGTQMSGPTSFSLEVWFNTTDRTYNGKLFGFADVTTPASQTHYDRHIYIDNAGRVLFGVYPGGQAVVKSPVGTNYADGHWHQVVATSTATSIALYLDGVPVSSRADTAGQDVYAGYWQVGCGLLAQWQDASGTQLAFADYYSGSLRFAAAYDRTLTAAEVNAHYLAATN